MSFESLLAPFLTWQFILAATLINAILIYVTRITREANPALADRRLFKVILTMLNPVLGLAIAAIPDFLFGVRFVERAFVGVCAGFLSNFIYALIIKRIVRGVDGNNDGVPSAPASEAVTKTEKPDLEKSK
jgi:energy-converting hydrogenase Eha subunit A